MFLGIYAGYEYFRQIIGKSIEEIIDLSKQMNIDLTEKEAEEIKKFSEELIDETSSNANDSNNNVKLIDIEDFKRIIEELDK